MSHFFTFISVSFLPAMTLLIIIFALYKKAPVYDLFISGARKGLETSLEILPYMIGIFFAVNSLTSSGFLNLIDKLVSPIFTFLQIPCEILPLMLLRALSGSGSYIVLQDILEKVSPDSYAGRVACVMTGGCETVLYVLALYFSGTHVKEMRHALKGGLIGYFVGIVVSIIICRII